jgi:RimJ/RimL family protein N-acetyltransferase
MAYRFRRLDETAIFTIAEWRYEPPYDIYDLGPIDDEDLAYFLDPELAFHSIVDEAGALVAYCSFGLDGQVPGGDYSIEALDIGLGVRPNLTGRGQGPTFVQTVLDFAQTQYAPAAFRVTIAEFNQRALHVWQKVGFRPVQRFETSFDGRPFIVLMREA